MHIIILGLDVFLLLLLILGRAGYEVLLKIHLEETAKPSIQKLQKKIARGQDLSPQDMDELTTIKYRTLLLELINSYTEVLLIVVTLTTVGLVLHKLL